MDLFFLRKCWMVILFLQGVVTTIVIRRFSKGSLFCARAVKISNSHSVVKKSDDLQRRPLLQ